MMWTVSARTPTVSFECARDAEALGGVPVFLCGWKGWLGLVAVEMKSLEPGRLDICRSRLTGKMSPA